MTFNYSIGPDYGEGCLDFEDFSHYFNEFSIAKWNLGSRMANFSCNLPPSNQRGNLAYVSLDLALTIDTGKPLFLVIRSEEYKDSQLITWYSCNPMLGGVTGNCYESINGDVDAYYFWKADEASKEVANYLCNPYVKKSANWTTIPPLADC